jgi:Domain of unkown function (DUF1775)
VYRTRARVATIVAASLALVAAAAPAFAHTQATIDNPRAGATNVLLSLDAEAESTTAGIRSLDVTLPEGITPAQVTLVTGPNGWTFTRTDGGFTIAGTALAVGAHAKTTLRVAQLPGTARVLAFRTLVTYNDGKVDRWIEVPSSAVPSPPNPAATVSLRPPASPSPTAAAASTIVSPGAVIRGNASPAATAPTSKSDTAWLWVVVGAGLVLLLFIGVLLWRRRTRLHTND